MHCLGVVASVEQAIGLQQHSEACLEEAGREERSVPWAPGHEAEVICKHTWLTAERAFANSIHSLGLPPRSDHSGLTLELQGKSFFQGVRFSVQTTSRGSTA